MKNVIFLFVSFIIILTGCNNKFEIQSSAFKNNERIPDKYCRGIAEERQNISLPFNWINAPEGTQSFALIMYDISARNFLHWAVINIPANCNEIIENASENNMPEGSIELTNQFFTSGYGGPEPPRKSGVHEYVTTLYALNTLEIIDISGYKSFTELTKILEGKIIAKAEITGTYSAE